MSHSRSLTESPPDDTGQTSVSASCALRVQSIEQWHYKPRAVYLGIAVLPLRFWPGPRGLGDWVLSLVTHKREKNRDCLFLVTVQTRQNTFTFSVQRRLSRRPNGCTPGCMRATLALLARSVLDVEEGLVKLQVSFSSLARACGEPCKTDFCIDAAAGVFGGGRSRPSSRGLVLVEAVNTCIRLSLV